MNPKVSVCLITKNEEANIENCLKSVQDIAYEIIVVDTGSTDKTKKILKAYNNMPLKIYDFKWNDDFSQARNESIKYASGDWILVIDADEELTEETRKNILPFLETQPYKDEPIAYSLKILEPKGITFKTVLFKSSCGIHFVKPLHEHLFRENDSLIMARADFLTIVHTAYKNITKEELKKKNEKYITKLLKIIREKSNSSDKSYYCYHLGNSYSSNEQFNNAIKAYQDGYNFYNQSKRVKKSKLYGNILLSLIKTLIFNKKKYTEAIPYIEELLSISPDLPDALFYLAYCHEYLENYSKAIGIYESIIILLGQDNPDKLDPLGIYTLQDYLYLMLMLELGRCYIVTGDMSKALFCLNKAYSQNDSQREPWRKNVPELLTILTLFYFLENDLSKIIYYYQHNDIDLSAEDKEFLINISKLPFEDIRYKNTLGTFLKMLENTKIDWLKDELKLIRDKVRDLNLSLPKISVYIITMNQEKYIENCLKSVLPVANEITVIDTGSTDNTKDIAAKYARVLEIKSNNDSEIKLKNHLLETSGGEWILFLNGNEELAEETQKNLLNFLNEQQKVYFNKAVVFYLKFINYDSQEGYIKANLIKNSFKIRYADNEQIYSAEHKLKLVITSFSVYYRDNHK